MTAAFVVTRSNATHMLEKVFKSVWWTREEAEAECLRLAIDEVEHILGYILRTRIDRAGEHREFLVEHKLGGGNATRWGVRASYCVREEEIQGSAVLALAALARDA